VSGLKTDKKMIKKVIVFTVIVLLVGGFNLIQIPAIQAAEADQYCTPGTAWVTVNGHSSIFQTFTPSQNRLTRVGLWMKGDADGTVNLRVRKGNDTICYATRSEPDGYKLIYFDFNDIELTPGVTYILFVTTGSGNTSLGWHRSASGSDCYAGGAAYLDGEEKDYDWGFATYGYTYTPPEPGDEDQDQDGESQSNSSSKDIDYSSQKGVTSGSNKAPMAVIDPNLNVPKLLKAEDVADDQGGAIKLTWKRINANAGYKIFRSTKKQFKSFRNIALASKKTTKFVDTKAKTGQKYYYFIRNYLEGAESASSNQVDAVAIDNIKPQTPENFKLAEQSDQSLKFTWDANQEEDLSGYLLTAYNKEGAIEDPSPSLEVGLAKETKEYELVISDHPELGNIDSYNFFLQAKDVNGNLSQDAGPAAAQGQAKPNPWTRYLLLAILAAVDIGLIFYLDRLNKKSNS